MRPRPLRHRRLRGEAMEWGRGVVVAADLGLLRLRRTLNDRKQAAEGLQV